MTSSTPEPVETHVPAWDADSLSETFGEKLIRLRSMEPGLRRVAGVAIAGVVVAGLLVAGRELPFDRVAIGGAGHPAEVSAPLLFSCVALQVLAWGLLLAGGMHAHWPLRAVVLVVWSGAMLTLLEGSFGAAGGSGGLAVPYATAAGILIVMAVVWQIAVGVSLLDRSLPGSTRTHRHRLGLPTSAACLAATVVVYLLAWLADPSANGLATDAGSQGLFVAPFMIAVFVVTGSDFAEWAEVAGGRVGTVLARRRPALLAIASGVVALALVADGVRVSGGPWLVAAAVLELATLAGLAIGLGRLLVPRPPAEIPPATLIVTALAVLVTGIMVPPVLAVVANSLFAASYLLVLSVVGAALADSAQRLAVVLVGVTPLDLPRPAFLALQALLVPAAAALVLLARRVPRLALAALFFAVMAAAVLWGVVINAALGLGNGTRVLPDLAVGPALGCLVLLGWCAATRDWSRRNLALLRMGLVLAVGLQVLAWLRDAFGAAVAHGEAFTLLQGLLLVGAMLWDLAMSGGTITNRHGPRAPRHARVLLYVGYTLLVSATIAFWTFDVSGNQLGGSSDQWVYDGLGLIGPPLLVTYFAFGVLRSWPRSSLSGRDEPE